MSHEAATAAATGSSVPRLAPLEPIRARSTRAFGWVWLATASLWASILLPALSVGLVNHYDDPNANFIDGLYQRKDLAAAARPPEAGRRLVIVGGSASLFGIDAELIERTLHVPTINYATHAGIGLEYELDRARRVLRPGDIMLWSVEYSGGWADNYPFPSVAWDYFISYDTRYLLDIDATRAIRALYSIPIDEYARSLNRLQLRLRDRHVPYRAFYNSSTLSPNGDMRLDIAHSTGFPPVQGYAFPDPVPPRIARIVREFGAWAKQNRVQLLFTWPNFCRPERWIAPATPPASLSRLLDEAGFAVLDTPSDNTFPRPWFYDTDFHINSACRRLRTEALIGRLRPYLGGEPAPSTSAYFLMTGGIHHLSPANLRAGLAFRYLSADPVEDPDAVTPAQVAALYATGRPIYYDDLQVEQVMFDQGFTWRELIRHEVSLADLFRQYPRHVFLVMRPDVAAWDEAPNPSVPAVLGAALKRPAAFAAVVGTGPYAAIGRELPHKRLRTELSSLCGQSGPPMLIEMDLTPRNLPTPILSVNAHNWARSRHGLYVVVIEPRQAIIVDTKVFAPGGTDVDYRLRQLERRAGNATTAATAAGETVQALAVERLGPVGNPPPRLRPEGAVMRFTPVAPYAAIVMPWLDVRGTHRSGVLTLSVRADAPADLMTTLRTNRSDLFEFLPRETPVHIEPSAPRQVNLRFVLRRGAHFGPHDWAVGSIESMDGQATLRVGPCQITWLKD